MKALVFASRGLPSFAQAKRLTELLTAYDARLVDKLSSRVEDLELVASYGVVEPVVFILYDKSGVRVRLTELPLPDQVEATVLRILHHAPD